ncbi:MAG: TusE/DsrC/DsvC family sulfur relay protein [Proteobacteria bacterium]|nr:TusE/DsrC/DsvC family sulfur relay protein [Pseudomonadota bacterium]
MDSFQYKNVTYELDDQGCLVDLAAWNKDFAEGMARICDVPVLSTEHWDVINYVRDVFDKTGVCPTIFAACKANGLRPQEMQKLFPTGYHRGVCRIAGVCYRVSNIPYGLHIRQSVAELRAMSGGDKVYTTDVRGFLVDPDLWDENFAVHRAMEMNIPDGKLLDDHWRIIYYLRDVYQVQHRIPNIYETCESCDLDLDTFELLFPDGYHRGALKTAGLRFVK